MNKDKIYPAPEKGEPWTSVGRAELFEKGFRLSEDGSYFYHPKCLDLAVVKHVDAGWNVVLLKAGTDIEQGLIVDKILKYPIREVKYMYQIDNMFHGFTDRWLGLI